MSDPGPQFFSLPLYTPFPTHPAHRRRVALEQKKIERLTKTGLEEGMFDSEEEEVDQLEEAADAEWVGVGPDWDPFGDEVELCR